MPRNQINNADNPETEVDVRRELLLREGSMASERLLPANIGRRLSEIRRRVPSARHSPLGRIVKKLRSGGDTGSVTARLSAGRLERLWLD